MKTFDEMKRIVNEWASTHTDVKVESEITNALPDYDVPETLMITVEDANDETKYISFHVSNANTWINVSPNRHMTHPIYVNAVDESDDMDENESERLNAYADTIIDHIRKGA